MEERKQTQKPGDEFWQATWRALELSDESEAPQAADQEETPTRSGKDKRPN